MKKIARLDKRLEERIRIIIEGAVAVMARLAHIEKTA